jgi:ribosome-associated heat shock protein Hsp15
VRIDKFCWTIRLFKTRSLAADAIKNKKVMVNAALCKASRELKPGDKIQVKKNNIAFEYKVLQFPKNRVGAKLVAEYVQDITPSEEMQKFELLKAQYKLGRDRGLGRPTKKDRRELDDFMDDFDDWEDWEE